MVYLIFNVYKQHKNYRYDLRDQHLEEISINLDDNNFNVGDYVIISGSKKNPYLEKVQRPDNFLDFYPQASKNTYQLKDSLNHFVLQIKNPMYLDIINDLVFNNELFFLYPAAKKIHHAYIGGLAQHTLNILNLAQGFIKQYHLDKDLLYTGIILHDYGKIYEFEAYGLNYSKEGSLLGHIMLCYEQIVSSALKLGYNQADLMLLKHMILSHHGLYEYGSPKEPMLKEAVILHVLDDTDAKMDIINKALEGINEDELTPPIALLNRNRFYKNFKGDKHE